MEAKLISVNPKDCTGCRLCEMACSFHHEQACSSAMSRIKIVKDDEYGHHLVIVCMQCAEPYCVASCPVEALRRNGETGIVLVDEELCTGCAACIEACPLEAISLDKEKNTVFKCDLCGGDPECVKVCAREILTLKEIDPASPTRKSFMNETSKLLLKMYGTGKSQHSRFSI